jgi:hypothetical protein
MGKTQLVDIDLIRIDGGTQARVITNLDVVADYAEHYRDETMASTAATLLPRPGLPSSTASFTPAPSGMPSCSPFRQTTPTA